MRKDNRTWYCTFASLTLPIRLLVYDELWKSKESTLIVHVSYQCGSVGCKQAFRCVWLVNSSLLFCCIAFVQKRGRKCFTYRRIKGSGKRGSLPSFVFPLLFVCSAHSSGSWSIRCWRMVFIRKKMKARQLLIYMVRFNCVTCFGLVIQNHKTARCVSYYEEFTLSIRPHWAPIGCRVVWLLDE